MTPAEAAEWLAVSLLGLTADSLSAAFKKRAKETHPDAGGNQADFLKTVQAKSVLEEFASKDPGPETQGQGSKCDVCNGRGKIQMMRGFAVVLLRCMNCNGRGRIG